MRRWPLSLLLLSLAACGVDAPSPALETGLAPLAASNAADCPATWAEARQRCASSSPGCTGFGAHCSYPGVGDQLPDGSWATAVLFCFDTSGSGAGPGEWRCAQ